MSSITKSIILGLTGATMLATAANAGGYSRGSANLDPLFDDGNAFVTSALVTSPSRGYGTVNGIDASVYAAPGLGNAGEDYASTYVTFSGTGAFAIGSTGAKCAVSYAQPFGANADYGWAQILYSGGVANTTSSELSSHEFGGTCGYSMQAGKGKVHLIGGLFYQQARYFEERGFGYDSFATGFRGGDIELSDGSLGYRLGVGYTIPEIALKATLVYRSEVSHDFTGTLRNDAVGGVVDAFAQAKTPQSVKLGLLSGVAPGWLVFGSVEWTDWSVLQQINVTLDAAGNVLTPLSVDAFFRDGWTVSGGVGHQLTEKLAVQSSLTWDRGTSAVFGGDEVSGFTDTWTIAAGGRYSLSEKASVSAGLAYSILTAGEYTTLGGDVIGLDQDNAISGGLSFNVKF